MKALLELGGGSPGGTRRRWGTVGVGHPTVPEQLADRWPGEPGGRLIAGRFRLRSLLGRGGMGRVWLADDELLDRPVAVNQLQAPRAVQMRYGPGDDGQSISRYADVSISSRLIFQHRPPRRLSAIPIASR